MIHLRRRRARVRACVCVCVCVACIWLLIQLNQQFFRSSLFYLLTCRHCQFGKVLFTFCCCCCFFLLLLLMLLLRLLSNNIFIGRHTRHETTRCLLIAFYELYILIGNSDDASKVTWSLFFFSWFFYFSLLYHFVCFFCALFIYKRVCLSSIEFSPNYVFAQFNRNANWWNNNDSKCENAN